MTVTPLQDFVLAALLPEPKPDSALVVVDWRPRNTCRAQILAVGPEVRDTRVGQTVVISRLQGTTIGSEQVLLRESAVLGYLNGVP